MSDDAAVALAATALLFLNEEGEPDRVTLDDAKAVRQRAFTAAEVAFRRDLANSKTSADCDDALALWKSRADEAQAQFYRALRRSDRARG